MKDDEDESLAPDELNLAKLFAGPNDFNDVSFLPHLAYSGLLPKTVSFQSSF